MGLAGVGKNYNPSTLNQWLNSHGGYVQQDLIVWGSVSPLGLNFLGKLNITQQRSIMIELKQILMLEMLLL